MLRRGVEFPSRAESIVERFAEREPLTQSLAYLGLLQERGWSCLAVGAALMIMRQREDGIFAQMQRPRALDIGTLDLIRERTGARRVLVEPALRVVLTDRANLRTHLDFDSAAPEDYARRLEALGWTAARPKAHPKSLVCDLSRGPDAVLPSLGSTARRNVRVALAHAEVRYTCRPFADLDSSLRAELDALALDFQRTHPALSDSRALWTGLTRHFDRSGFLVTARDDKELLGAIYMPIHDRVAAYFAAISTDRARALRVPTGLAYTAMCGAAAAGCDLFDFVGLWDERYPERAKSWRGFSTFKRRFGGQAVELPPSFQTGP